MSTLQMPTDPAELLHACCTLSLKPRSPSMIPRWVEAYGIFRRAGMSRDDLDIAVFALEASGVFSDGPPTELTRKFDFRLRLNQNEWAAVRTTVFKRDGFVCTYCGSDGFLECDHVVPISRGGSNQLDNLTTACRSCNRSKGDKLVSEWRS